jgi:hypothetical protein
MSEPLSKLLGLERKKESPHDGHTMDDNWCYDCDMIVQDGDLPVGNHRYNNALDDLDQRSPDVVKLAFIIYKVGMRNLASEDEIKSTFNMHHVTWNPTVNECYVKAQEIINKMSVWLVKKG